MKKTALALFASAFMASSASAVELFNLDSTGTKAEFIGSARVKWTSTSTKDTYQNGSAVRNHVNKPVQNNGSRFGFRLTQQLGSGVYALGRVEWRLRGADERGVSSSQHDFDHIYAHQLYAGFGHKQYGEVTYGNQTVITDEVKQTDIPNTLSLSDGLLVSGARRSVQYVYKGIEGLKVGAYYGGHNQRSNTNMDLSQDRKDVWGFGSIYNHKFDDVQSVQVATGFSRERFERIGSAPAYDRNAYSVGAAYTYDKTTFGVDLERRKTENQSVQGNERTEKEVRTLVYHRLTDDWRAYGMYAYKTNRLERAIGRDNNEKKHQFMVGTEYYLPKVVDQLKTKLFVEWQATRTKHPEAKVARGVNKSRDYTTVVGFRAYW
ncbi:porin [Actinobacillus pleuropneumoniae]|nr:porin [Actinobacillus pleuropneumoniae]EFL80632.1 outer membrane protein P2 [Actinobacillus pleuropneumoniae serovar 6 str. Femo]UKH12481.1 porin [Actinobacillus pleuropneumoniae serovar 6 str. Femo]UKH17557.1 porin [Actinobacillus pleuropneumoniae]UKH27798.1 porin [Actinobacillus pleuropneumoniae]SUU55838.1 outer membrane protein P2 [Actinobacillus pleuropneumoniae]